MARPKSYDHESLTDSALAVFWQHGFYATSMDDLVRAANVSRHGIYSEFGGKKALYLACFERYQVSIVDPAFNTVERPTASLKDIENYFEHQIALAESTGLPGLGCLVANASTEIAPHDKDVEAKVLFHNARLKRGFFGALQNSAPTSSKIEIKSVEQLASILVVFTNGLWSLSRNTDDASMLRGLVASFLNTIREQLK